MISSLAVSLTGIWKLVYHTDDMHELYHLARDPDEHENLFGRPEVAAIERDLLMKIVNTLGTHRRQGFNRGSNSF